MLLIAAITTSQTSHALCPLKGALCSAACSAQSQQRKQKQRKARRQCGLLHAQAGVVLDIEILFAALAEVRDHEKGTNLHQRICGEIEQNSNDAEIGGSGKRNEDVTRVCNRGVGQHALYV